MTSKKLLCAVAILLAAPLARAADNAPASATSDPNKAGDSAAKPAVVAQQTASGGAPLEEIVHGMYMQMRVGGGYMVKGGSIPYDPAYPQLGGTSEELGAGPAVDFALGYELIPAVAIQAVGGMTFSGGRRTDRVRGLSVAYGGLGVRLSFPIEERLNFVLTPQVVYASSSTDVEKSTQGVGAMLSGGIEYYAHVRHISFGLDLSVQAPLSPVRVFVGLEPYIRYSF
jgi:hypothetical protein